MSQRSIPVLPEEGGPLLPAETGTVADSRPVSPFKAVHRVLRGRYRWAALLGLLGAAGGAYLGWNSQVPLYQSQAIVYIAPSLPSLDDPTGQVVLPMFRGFVDYQVTLLGSERTTNAAMMTDAWQQTGEGMTPEATARFVEHRNIIHDGDTHHVLVQFTDKNPDVAIAGLTALLQAYEKLSKEQSSNDEGLQYANTQVEVLTAKLKQATDQILKLAAAYGGEDGLELRHRASVTKVLEMEGELAKVQSDIHDQTSPPSPQTAPTPKSVEEIAVESPQLAAELLQVELLEAQANLLAQTAGEKNERLASIRQEIQVRRRWIDKFVEEWNKRALAEFTRRQSGGKSAEATLAELKARETTLSEQLALLRTRSQELGKTRVEIAELRADIENSTRDLEKAKTMKSQLTSEVAESGRIRITDWGRKPTLPSKDRRRVIGSMGGVFGGALGVLVVFLFGLRDRRFRTTADVGTSLSRLRLLGLMPALPTDLADPQGREIAAHCVHQIRTLLQMRHPGVHGVSFCVTGPGVGSGKTTLTLALGLSFARSGTRTLIVDADLSGRSLTWRVSQMLLAHARSTSDAQGAARPLEARERAGGAASFMQPLAPEASDSSRPGIAELAGLLSRAVELEGLPDARKPGIVEEILALADLMYPGDGRALILRHLATLGKSGGRLLDCEAASPFGCPIAELDAAHPEFNGLPLDRYLFPTGVASLSFLPLRGLGVGGSVSVATISRILGKLREAFDVVLVDSGPVLGAVETPIVAAHTDAAVFVVSPGDDRPDADRAAARLEEVGATIAGVVFNRAEPRDVLKSSRSHSSMRGGGGPQ